MRKRLTWSVADQALSSGTNVVFMIAAAKALSPVAFGVFSLAFTLYLLLVILVRSVVLEPLLSTYEPGRSARTELSAAATTACAFACLLGVLLAVAGLLSTSSVRPAVLALAIVLPGLALQEACRHCFFAEARPARAFVNDLVWLSGMAIGLAIVLPAVDLTPAQAVLVWGAPATLAAALGVRQAGLRLAPDQIGPYLARHRGLSARYTGEAAAANAAAQATLLLLQAVAGLSALGAARAAMVALGPVNVLFTGIYVVLIPEGVRLRSEPARIRSHMTRASLGLAAFAALWTAAVAAMPDSVGRAFLGPTWDSAADLVVPFGVAIVAGGVAAGGVAGLRALAAARESLRVRIIGVPVVVGFPVGGALLNDARGFAIGTAIAAWMTAGLWWAGFRRASRRPTPSPLVQGA